VIAVWAQVDRRRVFADVQVDQPAGALAEPADLVDQTVADQVAPVQFGVVIPAGVFRGGPARGPQLSQGGVELTTSAASALGEPREKLDTNVQS
jgi:hypothetical protein